MMAIDTLMNRRVLLGVTGGIAAYKSAELVRRLKDAGADVRVVMTKGAQEFITPLTLQALSSNPVGTELLDSEAEAAMGHIEMAKWADAVLIAPATANFIAKLVIGEGTDLLSTLCLATQAPIFVAPAMNQAMWHSPATQENIQTLAKRDIKLLGPGSGEQACGDIGLGRMLDIPELISAFSANFSRGRMANKHIVITAGPTREPLDPVRYISNHSSGKMGVALAEAAIREGAKVTLVCGPVTIDTPSRCNVISVTTAKEMLDECEALTQANVIDIFIATAAVADYRAVTVAQQKIKKQGDDDHLTLTLVKNPDILATIASSCHRPKIVVGFAAETQSVVDYAKGKLLRKGLDAIVANDVSIPGSGFNANSNSATFITSAEEIDLPLMSKTLMAEKIIRIISDLD